MGTHRSQGVERPHRTVTVVICSRDRRERLLRSLRRVAEQSCPFPWTVLVVDNGSSDGTEAAVNALAADFPVPLRCVREPLEGLSHARNRALEAATGDVLVWTDDDTEPRPGWLEAHARAYADGDVLGVGGRILVELPHDASPEWRAALACQVGGPTARYDFGDTARDVRDGRQPFPFGANMSFDRKLARGVGGFRSDLGWGSGVPSEDSEFFRRFACLPGRVLYVPEATVVHRIEAERLTLAFFERWHRGRGRAKVRIESPKRQEKLLKQLVGLGVKAARCRVAELRASSLAERLESLQARAQAEGSAVEVLARLNKLRAGW